MGINQRGKNFPNLIIDAKFAPEPDITLSDKISADKNFGGQNFHQLFLISPYTWQEKYILTFISIWLVFSWQNKNGKEHLVSKIFTVVAPNTYSY